MPKGPKRQQPRKEGAPCQGPSLIVWEEARSLHPCRDYAEAKYSGVSLRPSAWPPAARMAHQVAHRSSPGFSLQA